jgi:uncharacterized 2Fe-2S/4Fe-4S cluster protein (DUF4445 family)
MSLVRIRLEPLGRTIEVAQGAPLADVLFSYGVEFPCGGRGRCRRCKVRVLAGTLAASPVADDPREPKVRVLAGTLAAAPAADDPREPDGTWLACRCRAEADVTLELAQWETSILADDSPFAFTPREGFGVAVDLGTTTLVAQLLDLRTAHVLGVRTALNPQVQHGADIMSRVEFAVHGGARKLRDLIRSEVERLIRDLAPPEPPRRIAIAGNTVMHHLYCGIGLEPLAHVPFEPSYLGLVEVDEATRFLPCLGGFVGSDILAGLLATRMHEREELAVLMDLGTNGEIVVGNRDRLLCCSTAAGPAFEGGRISMGMRAATGAIAEVAIEDGRMRCHVLGGGAPRGICGSGLVDAVAAGLDLGLVLPNGRLAGAARQLPLDLPVVLTQQDIRELQLAKGAMAAGVEILLGRWGASPDQVDRVYLAGAFGNYLNRTSARRIGLLPFGEEQVQPAGNTSLLGAKLALFEDGDFAQLRNRVEHVPLGADPEFQERYIEAIPFPPPA